MTLLSLFKTAAMEGKHASAHGDRDGADIPDIPHPGAELDRVAAALDTILLDKAEPVRLAFTCLLARGHLLIEDLPGLGKTVLAHALARVLGLEFKRVQFTNDLLPADVLGGSVFDRDKGCFEFHPGPVFTQVLLADEINRASPKTQSALLEAMEERQVSSDGVTRKLPQPFFVLATQNPVDQLSSHPLPEAQLDRFMMRISIGYPGRDAELEVLKGEDRRQLIERLEPLADAPTLLSWQEQARGVMASDAALDYLYALVDHTRHHRDFRHGLSTRGAQALLAGARAWAFLGGRDHIIPADVQAVFPAIAGHRLPGAGDARAARTVCESLLSAVPIP